MNKQIDKFVIESKTDILARAGKVIEGRAIVIVDEIFRRTELVVIESVKETGKAIEHPMIEKSFQEYIRSIIRGLPTEPVEPVDMAEAVATNQIGKAITEYLG